MSYQPIVPNSGYAGWGFLNRTMASQKAAFVASAEVQTQEAYFREKIGSITSAEDLVADRRLLGVALGAFGLDEDIGNTFFIRKVLEEGSLDGEALANKLSDKRYLAFTKAFGFGNYSTPRTVISDFADEIIGRYETQQFEIAVGDADGDMRLALALQRDLPEVAAKDTSVATKWYTIIGSGSLSSVFQTALGLPPSIASLDVDQQVTIYAQKTEAFYGFSDPGQFAEAGALEKLTRDFFLRSQIDSGGSISSGNAALMLLQGAGTSSFSLLL
ncbi:DUF1217 domain-containing protein [Thioclava pacifica]|uniref:Flagellar protein n=1 Tax=Thioclava pacifica DSM 10166 TaxID=1353537 RepID=A0A074JEG1_9RHOB|nr:DUF1217 domain-containing protein [Thioclava pacifica]KEO54235.1 hypothetical protein TP2_04750 [Thioclava pacifica DSM 10166]